MFAQVAIPLPQDPQVESGTATFEIKDNVMSVTASDKAVINYSSFSIAANESVIITLPDITSSILNRDIGGSASNLGGALTCNGLFILINTSGIYVAPTANINVGSLVLSTRDITTRDFLNSNYLFTKITKDELDRLLLNAGTITVQPGGFAALISGAVENNGAIAVRCGKIVLASGDAIRLNISGNRLISVAIEEKAAQKVYDYNGNPLADAIKNTGLIESNGGVVMLHASSLSDIFSLAINQDGVARATRMENVDGRIFFTSDGVNVNTGTIDTELFKEIGYSFRSSGTIMGGKAYYDNKDGAAYIQGNIGSDQTDTYNLVVDGDITLIADDLTFTAGDNETSTGVFYMQAGTKIDGGALTRYNLTIKSGNTAAAGERLDGGESPTLENFANIGILTLDNTPTGPSSPQYVSDPTTTTWDITDFRITVNAKLDRFTGEGATDDPYVVYDVYGLQAMKDYLTSTFILDGDIDASGTANWNAGAGFVPIGDNGSQFTGSLNGQGHAVSDLFMDRDSDVGTTGYFGLFGYIGNGGVVRNLGMNRPDISGTGADGGPNQSGFSVFVGSLAGYNAGTIENCFAADGETVGVGGNGCVYTSGGYPAAGGFAYAGGIAGKNDGTIVNSYSSAGDTFVSAQGGSGGYSYATKTGYSGGYAYAGGIAGKNEGSIYNSYAAGGGTIEAYGGDGHYGYVQGGRGGNAYAGGVVGENVGDESGNAIENSFSSVGNVVAYGGNGGDAFYYYFYPGPPVGGTGGNGGNGYAGGLIGLSEKGRLSESFSQTQTVTGNRGVGGSGLIDDGADGVGYGGGIIGINQTSSNITNAYASGTVAADDASGGLIGFDDNTNFYTATFWDTESSGLAEGTGNNGTLGGMTGLATADMQLKDDFVDAGWDFNGLWKEVIGSYHELIWQGMNNGDFIGGTNDVPYVISDINELQFMMYDLDGAYQLGGDIDASATSRWSGGFSPIGYDSANAFTGSLTNPDGYEISNLYINHVADSNPGYFGLFGVIGPDGRVDGIGLVDPDITGNGISGPGLSGGTVFVGAIAGYNKGTISNSYAVGGQVSGTGGDGDSYYSGDPGGNAFVGGLVGANDGVDGKGLITNSYSSVGATSGTGGTGATLAHFPYYIWYGGAGGDACVGGVAGENINGAIISGSYVAPEDGGTISVEGTGGAGGDGALGDGRGGVAKVGGLVGYNDRSEIKDTETSDSYAKVEEVTATGGSSNGRSGDASAGGLVGVNWEGTISNSYSLSVNVTANGGSGGGQGGDAYAGGLVGYNYTAYISNSYSEVGEVHANGGDAAYYSYDSGGDAYAGGLIGSNYNDERANVDNCYSVIGTIISAQGGNGDYYTGGGSGGDAYAGALIGNNEYSDIIDSNARNAEGSSATVEAIGGNGGYSGGDAYAGGLVGRHESGTISNSYSVIGSTEATGGGPATGGYYYQCYIGGNAYAGGLVGYNDSGNIKDNSYAQGGDVTAKSGDATIGYGYYDGNGGNASAGGLVGYSENGAIENSYSDGGNTTATGGRGYYAGGKAYAGGLVGANYYCSISYSHAAGASATVEARGGDGQPGGDAFGGGLVGKNSDGNISNSYSTIDTTKATGGDGTDWTNAGNGGYAYAGGLVGYNEWSDISNSYATGGATATGGAGGYGLDGGDGYGYGGFGGNAYAGGLVGYKASGVIYNGSYAKGNAEAIGGQGGDGYTDGGDGGDAYAGGLVGRNNEDIGDPNDVVYATGSVTAIGGNGGEGNDGYGGDGGDAYAGGLAGFNNSTIRNSYSTDGTTTAEGGNGGYGYGYYGGYNYFGGDGGGAYAGGFVGFNNSVIESSYSSSGTTTATGGDGGDAGYYWGGNGGNAYAGGFAGYNNNDIHNTYSTTGAVTASGGLGGWDYYNIYQTPGGYAFAGGFVGANHGTTTIYNSYSQNNATATPGNDVDSYAGGFVGDNPGSINNCFATGTVTGTSSADTVGPFVGSGSVPTDSYYTGSAANLGTGGVNDQPGAEYKTTEDVLKGSTHTAPVYGTWDFETPFWDAFDTALPHLSWEGYVPPAPPEPTPTPEPAPENALEEALSSDAGQRDTTPTIFIQDSLTEFKPVELPPGALILSGEFVNTEEEEGG
ncbi:MAG: filamentous hemagglutinin N-terminal domain-containing protein [Candidatus Omnitrophica bacterium]|nr:filamentous hemagglutinin N-terminal domain-containing protein [Candidatus Omnitrophota bacterium]